MIRPARTPITEDKIIKQANLLNILNDPKNSINDNSTFFETKSNSVNSQCILNNITKNPYKQILDELSESNSNYNRSKRNLTLTQLNNTNKTFNSNLSQFNDFLNINDKIEQKESLTSHKTKLNDSNNKKGVEKYLMNFKILA